MKCNIVPGCGFTFTTKSELAEHIAAKHRGVRNIVRAGDVVEARKQTCRVGSCEFATDFDNVMLDHVRSVHCGVRVKKEGLKWLAR